MTGSTFRLFTGEGTRRDEKPKLPKAPPWRTFDNPDDAPEPPKEDTGRLRTWARIRDDTVIDRVNAAIVLRRPLLVTGGPGSGKSTLAEIIATELHLGPVLRWPITSSSRLATALYEYDPIGRVQDPASNLGRFITLGPLGTALLPWNRPRVLLVDEIDKSDIDLPNDLLHVFERGEYDIRELQRSQQPEDRSAEVMTADRGTTVVKNGVVRCAQFPVVVLTSNQERMFPAPFLRRCLRLEMQTPKGKQLEDILANQVGDHPDVQEIIDEFERKLEQNKTCAVDQILNAVFLLSSTDVLDGNWDEIREALLADLEGPSM